MSRSVCRGGRLRTVKEAWTLGRVPERYRQRAANNFWTLIGRYYRNGMKEIQTCAVLRRGEAADSGRVVHTPAALWGFRGFRFVMQGQM